MFKIIKFQNRCVFLNVQHNLTSKHKYILVSEMKDRHKLVICWPVELSPNILFTMFAKLPPILEDIL